MFPLKKGKSERSIEVAGAKLNEAERTFNHGLLDATVVLVYTIMFHAARAILLSIYEGG